jgi:transcriptional regulator with XRE-family HTH domain
MSGDASGRCVRIRTLRSSKRDARLTTLAKIAAALRVPIRTLLEDPADAASTGGDVPAEGYDLGDYL